MVLSLKGHFCTSGMKMPCQPGYYCPERRLSNQLKCEAGYYCSIVTENHQMCHPGSYSEAKATECSSCQPGTEGGSEISADLIQDKCQLDSALFSKSF